MDELEGKSLPVKIFINLLPTFIGLCVMAGGWVYNYATTQQQLFDLNRRTTTLEQSYVSNRENEDWKTYVKQRMDRIDDNIKEVRTLLIEHTTQRTK